jgi:hypothetical protein
VDAGVADLLSVLDHRHVAHHGLLAELVQRLEVEVAESFVPAAGVVVLPRGEAERLRGLEMEDVEAAGPAVHLDEEAPTAIPDAEHALVDLHLGPPFIEVLVTMAGHLLLQRGEAKGEILDLLTRTEGEVLHTPCAIAAEWCSERGRRRCALRRWSPTPPWPTPCPRVVRPSPAVLRR